MGFLSCLFEINKLINVCKDINCVNLSLDKEYDKTINKL